ncbi:MAG: hypothetical protein L7S63_05155, partial [Flavobacteriales bacterium]|nr:hypothetical protein [Flavobacteriales bacterium]
QGTRIAGEDNDSYFDALALRLGSTTDCDGLPLSAQDPWGATRAPASLQIHPNPGPMDLTVSWPGCGLPLQAMRLTDAVGRKVDISVSETTEGWQVQRAGLAAGTYHLTALDATGHIARATWVITE